MASVTGFFVTFLMGVFYEKGENAKKENKTLKKNLGQSDDALADKLRRRAANKDRNKR